MKRVFENNKEKIDISSAIGVLVAKNDNKMNFDPETSQKITINSPLKIVSSYEMIVRLNK